MARRSTRQFPRSGNRPNRGWSFLNSTAAVAVPAASKVLLGFFTPNVGSVDETILRTVGSIYVESDQLAATE